VYRLANPRRGKDIHSNDLSGCHPAPIQSGEKSHCCFKLWWRVYSTWKADSHLKSAYWEMAF